MADIAIKINQRQGEAATVSGNDLDLAAELDLILLVEAFQSGEVKAFHQLFEIYGQTLSRFILHYTKDMDLAEDAFQETWMRVWKHRKNLKQSQKFKQWLYQIARNTSFRILKQKNKQMNIDLYGSQEELDVVGQQNDPERDPCEQAKIAQWKDAFDEELKLLDPISQEILMMRFGSDLNLTDISQLLDIPASTVSTKLNRALSKVRKRLETKGVEFPL